MTRKRIKHRVERTKNKHSRAVLQNDTIVIRLARGLNALEERRHIRDLLRRMTQYVLEEQQKKVIDPFRRLLNGGQQKTVTTATGKKYHFALKPGTRTYVEETARGWAITVGPQLRRRGLHALLWKILAAAEGERITNLVYLVNEQTFNARINRVKLQFTSSQWGSCSPGRVIAINTALIFTPPSVLRYIIVHELAHLRRADHSPAFWREVANNMPRYEEAMDRLQEYRLPTL